VGHSSKSIRKLEDPGNYSNDLEGDLSSLASTIRNPSRHANVDHSSKSVTKLKDRGSHSNEEQHGLIEFSCVLRCQDIVGYGLSPFFYGCVCKEENDVVLKIILIFRGTLLKQKRGTPWSYYDQVLTSHGTADPKSCQT